MEFLKDGVIRTAAVACVHGEGMAKRSGLVSIRLFVLLAAALGTVSGRFFFNFWLNQEIRMLFRFPERKFKGLTRILVLETKTPQTVVRNDETLASK